MPAASENYEAMKDHLTQATMAAAHHVAAPLPLRGEDRASMLLGIKLLRAELDHIERHVRINAKSHERAQADETTVQGFGAPCVACERVVLPSDVTTEAVKLARDIHDMGHLDSEPAADAYYHNHIVPAANKIIKLLNGGGTP